jgi:hypothetical protein
VTRSLRSKLMREGGRPAAVAERMNFHPDSVLPFAQLERARTARHPKVPMTATGASGQLPLASNDKTAPAALVEDLARGEPEPKFEHGGPRAPRLPALDSAERCGRDILHVHEQRCDKDHGSGK